jgi:hypothetical protein
MGKAPIAMLLLTAVSGWGRPCAAETYKTPQGVSYTVERVNGIKRDALPQNTDLKMADQDLARYAETACVLDVPAKTAPSRCDVYVQPDRDGTLIGYAAVTEDKAGVSFQTFTTLNEHKEPGGKHCYVGGKIYGDGADHQNVISDASRDFQGQVMYSAWEKNPGDFLISQVGPGDPTDVGPNSALGVWYILKKGDKLRISQERWNYCYRDANVIIDDVFFRAVSLLRVKHQN